MPLKTWVGRFSIVKGQVHEEGPWFGSFTRSSSEDDGDQLFILVEPATPGSEEFCGQLVEAVGRRYLHESLSLTGALQRALRTAHQQLADWNQRSLREHWVGAGASCMAVRGQTAFLAQVGPTVAYHYANGEMRRIEPEEDSVGPLGIAQQFEPQLRRFDLQPGDLLLVASSRLDGLADEEGVRRILARGADEALPELYLLSRGEQDFSAVLLACFEEEEKLSEVPPRPAAPIRRAGEEGVFEAAYGGDVQAPEYEGELESAPLESVLQAAMKLNAPPPEIAQPAVRLRGAQPSTRHRYARTTGLAAGMALPRIPREMLIVAAVLAAIIALAVFVIPNTVSEGREEKFTRLLNEARTAYNGAVPLQDPAQKRTLLRTADGDLEQAVAIHPDDQDLAALRSDVKKALAQLDAIVELRDLTPMVDFGSRIAGPIGITSVSAGGLGVYALDTDGGRVLVQPATGQNPQPSIAYQQGDKVGDATLGKPLAIAWSQEMLALLIIDESRQLFAYDPAHLGLRQLTVRGTQEWGSLDGMAYSNRALYIVDVTKKQVWRYMATDNGFDSEKVGLLSNADLRGARSLAVGRDLLVLTEGGVRRFDANGREQPFTFAGIDEPPASPASPFILPASSRLMVADLGNKRLLLASMDGVFLQQLVSPSFTSLKGAAADETARALFVVVGTTLYRGSLPN